MLQENLLRKEVCMCHPAFFKDLEGGPVNFSGSSVKGLPPCTIPVEQSGKAEENDSKGHQQKS